jgi:hypothetical protein
MRRTLVSGFRATLMALSEGNKTVAFAYPPRHHSADAPVHMRDHFSQEEHPMQPHNLRNEGAPPAAWTKHPIMGKMVDQAMPMYDDVLVGAARLMWQEPAKQWHHYEADEVFMLEEHDKEEWNDKPYVGVDHLYDPPLGSEIRPMRVEGTGNPGDIILLACQGQCAPHVPTGNYNIMLRGYQTSQCPMCQQYFYMHNRPWLVMHPDWTDEPAADEGPAYTFAEIESEFDRDFHEFGLYLNAE